MRKTRQVVITPYIDSAGIQLLKEAWDVRINRSAVWEIYVKSPLIGLKSLSQRPWKIFEYPASQSFGMHAKVILVDEKTVILGSMNLLKRSMYSNLELGAEISDDPIVRQISRLHYWLRRSSRLANSAKY